MPDQETADPPGQRNRPGELSLSLGLVALVFSFVPTLGELIAVPTGLAALVLGVVGARRCERGEAANLGWSLAGAALGVIALLIVVLVIAVVGSPVR
ncbi:hypothetical protein [Streptomyces spiramenti]|uniref:DUF4190 domain-containing protein n=1 Tax=Streptomyces spiramenti TaxID=2720606 RepID=A0ABX1ALF9_9ACTN|nr:hypothetical protein [Streptomyces spiramenti]NJP65312.1 hypothetical protein [Streptomyces spiramenti]